MKEIFIHVPDYGINDLESFIDRNNQFYLFGADEEGEYCLEWLKKRNKQVKAFVDNDKNKIGNYISNIVIESLDNVKDMTSKFIITSIHSDEIAKQLEKRGFKLFEHYISYDNLYWIDEKQFLDCIGLDFYNSFSKNKDKFYEVLSLLQDDYSRDIFSRIINFRLTSLTPIIRGKEYLPLPLEIHKERGRKKGEKRRGLYTEIKGRYSKSEEEMLVNNTVNATYEYFDIIKNENLKVIIDAGGFIGDTAIGFAYKNPSGIVYSFEPSEIGFEKIKILSRDFPNIYPVKKGLWNENCPLLFNEGEKQSNGSRVGEGNKIIDGITLDSFIQAQCISKVDFIKMDIEGAELNALDGARYVIERDKPDLAICIYHSPTDLWEIPLWIKRNFPEYKIYIDHTDGMFVWGTVCFATVR